MSEITGRLSTALADRYKIERRLGEGGMATVYLAEDLKHDRKVALKVLKAELAAVLGAERFVQEIKTTASLQHPHILPLFDSGEADSFLYYVMPYVDGETLREKLNRETQLSIDEAVRITIDVAEALQAAHDEGVIHRDIKPENVLLHKGRAMVADFGIALAVSAAAGGRMTETGLSLGTPHYMSPEQATAEKDLTNRSDLYSLGAVLYEMLTGDPPHTGSSAQQIIMKIVTEDVAPVARLRKTVPPNVAAAVAKALEKLSADRFASAAEFGEALADPNFVAPRVPSTGVSGGPARRAVTPVLMHALPWLVATIAVAVALFPRGRAAEPLPRRFDILLADSVAMEFIGEADIGAGQTAVALAHGGGLLAYAGRADATTRLYARDLRDGTLSAFPGTEGAYAPFFAPDDEWIAFFVGDELKKVSVSTGQVVAVAATPNPSGADWGPHGEIVVNIKDGSELILVSDAAGTVRPLPAAGPRTGTPYFPSFLPGGMHILGGCVLEHICVQSLTTGEVRYIAKAGPPKPLPAGEDAIRGRNPRYVPSGHLIFGRPGDGVLAAVPFDVETLEARGDEVQLMQGVRRESPISGVFQLAFSDDGLLVWAAGEDASTGTFVWADGQGGLDTLEFVSTAQYREFELSDDGRWLAAITTSESGRKELRVFDLVRESMFPWRHPIFEPNNVTWGPNSGWLLLTSVDGVVVRIDRGAPTGGDTVLAEDGMYPSSFLDDTTLLTLRFPATAEAGPTSGWRAYVIRGAAFDGEPVPLMDDGGYHLFPEPSPDRSWIAYTSNAPGPFDVYVMRNPPSEAPLRISRGGGELGMWSPDGHRLYYRNGRRWYYVERTNDEDEPFSEPAFFLEGGFHNVPGKDHAVSNDGRQLLLLKGPPDESTTVLHVMTNWFAELERLVTRKE